MRTLTLHVTVDITDAASKIESRYEPSLNRVVIDRIEDALRTVECDLDDLYAGQIGHDQITITLARQL